MIANIYRKQAYDSMISMFLCNGLIDIIVKSKSFLNSTYLYSPNKYENNDKMIIKYFQ